MTMMPKMRVGLDEMIHVVDGASQGMCNWPEQVHSYAGRSERLNGLVLTWKEQTLMPELVNDARSGVYTSKQLGSSPMNADEAAWLRAGRLSTWRGGVSYDRREGRLKRLCDQTQSYPHKCERTE